MSDPSSVVRGMDGTNSFSGWVNRGVIRMRMPNERFRSKWEKEGRSDAAKEGPMGVKEYERPRALSFLSFFLESLFCSVASPLICSALCL